MGHRRVPADGAREPCLHAGLRLRAAARDVEAHGRAEHRCRDGRARSRPQRLGDGLRERRAARKVGLRLRCEHGLGGRLAVPLALQRATLAALSAGPVKVGGTDAGAVAELGRRAGLGLQGRGIVCDPGVGKRRARRRCTALGGGAWRSALGEPLRRHGAVVAVAAELGRGGCRGALPPSGEGEELCLNRFSNGRALRRQARPLGRGADDGGRRHGRAKRRGAGRAHGGGAAARIRSVPAGGVRARDGHERHDALGRTAGRWDPGGVS
mmetsp:Transcript_18091/g.68332  ORF Transcript_18091/g.68332 Transcript_18091/m.68332 type:complete len:268 (+) Transcript_18091:604-1407(+)